MPNILKYVLLIAIIAALVYVIATNKSARSVVPWAALVSALASLMCVVMIAAVPGIGFGLIMALASQR